MKSINLKFKRITIKIGSNVISRGDGSLNVGRMLRLVEDIAVLWKQGTEVILVSSGAVAAGKGEMMPSRKTNIIAAKQIWASIGQVKLMSNYQFLFGKYGIRAGQILATRESFRDRRHYLNMKNCISAMLENNVLPVVNENDTVSVNELMFTDNDELSGLISSMMDCRSLVILSNVDGIFTAAPGCPGAELIKEVGSSTGDLTGFISPSGSGFGRGGMLTKYTTATKIASEGINVYIANGMKDAIITDILGGKDVPYTHFRAKAGKNNGVKKWLSHSDTFARGAVYINEGARSALTGEKATSLLMIGVTRMEGYFKKGDIIRILDEEGNALGLGKSQYDSVKAVQSIGEKREKPLIHYDYMVINEKIKEGVNI